MVREWLSIVFLYLSFSSFTPIFASPHGNLNATDTASDGNPIVTPVPGRNIAWGHNLERRQKDDGAETCGYHDGDPDRPRTAEDGFVCRIDTERGLWGFCPSTVLVASDCGLAGNCVDSYQCKRGCGITGTSGITTFTCKGDQLCSTVIMALNEDAGFSYIACGASALTHTIFPTPSDSTDVSTTESSESKSSSANSSSSPEREHPSTPTSEPEAESDGEDSSDTTNNTGAIIGGVIGGLALVCISAVTAVYLWRHNRNQKEIEEKQQPESASMPASYNLDFHRPVPAEPRVISELDGRNSKPSELPG